VTGRKNALYISFSIALFKSYNPKPDGRKGNAVQKWEGIMKR
jgi:hypothetical protein